MKAKVSRARAIREKCLDCCCGQSAEVRRCTCENCALFHFRMGKYKDPDNMSAIENDAENAEIFTEDEADDDPEEDE